LKKVSWKPVKPQTIYFLSVDEFTEFMGLGTSARSKLRLIGKYEPKLKKLPISNRSLDNLAKDGISYKLARKTAWVIFRCIYKVHNKKLLTSVRPFFKKTRKTDVIYSWLSGLKGWEISSRNDDIQLLYAFFEFRNQQYKPLKLFIDSSPKGNQYELAQRFYSIALPQTLLTEKEQFTIQNCVAKLKKGESGDQYDQECVVKFLYDFHLSLFATIDLVILSNLQITDDYEQGLLTMIFEQQGSTYFSKLLNGIKENLQISNASLAQHVPIGRDESKLISTSIQDAKKNTLRKWRNGKTKPESETLIKFFESLRKDSDFLPMLILSKICLALDKQIKKNPEIASAFQATFSSENYSKYFLYYKKKLPLMAVSE
jgi:hypothetical protein